MAFHLYGWVIIPDHIHLLLWPSIPDHPVSKVLHDLKRDFAREVIDRWRVLAARVLSRVTTPDGSARFWQHGGGYDRNIRSDEEFVEKLRYIHNNPVKRGLVDRPEAWRWSSVGWCAGDRLGLMSMDPLPATKPP